jgi:hypothetical protein
MKSTPCLAILKTPLLIVLLGSPFRGPTTVQAGDRDPLYPCAVRPGNLDARTELWQGYLKVYSATDEFNDGDAWYFPHSSYAIYTIEGKLFKNVENHISRSDEIPELVMLPVGAYAVEARSEQDGYVRIPVVIKEGRQTILHLDLREHKTLSRLVHN